MRKYSKIQSIIWFIFIALIIFAMYLFIYKQIDKLIPKRENNIYIFSIDSENEKTEFLYEMYEYIIQFDYYKKISENEVTNLISNPKIKKIFLGSNEIEEKYLEKVLSNLQIAKINNTKYGDLNVLINKYKYQKKKVVMDYVDYVVAYTDDFSKVFYFDVITTVYDVDYNSMSTSEITSETEKYFKEENLNNNSSANKPYDQDTNVIIQNAKQKFSQIMEDENFNPDTVMYTNPYHVLKDTENDITVYYDFSNNRIFGFYKGFGKF